MRLLDVIAHERAIYIKDILENACSGGDFISVSEHTCITSDMNFLMMIDEKIAREISALLQKVEVKHTAFDILGAENYD
ncbi:hypothetical protein QL989_16210 [Pseudoalteromonas sp. APC 3224]|uniref:hypothetical protein n=1 Tax=Pseudoalteromonas sp. APC 3224 TaxID=3035203 RepID=UPI0025B300BB|nr:hypothetical protein [Pseudoalteromonas sp. APC 3224]MDN3486883.1 hypothetical protein [Pseudoalteromonas sp. APC 3224]